MMMVMMVVMVMPRVSTCLDVAMRLVTMLALALQLQRHVPDAVLGKLLAHRVLDRVAVAVRHHVHRGIVALSVHRPHVHVMHVKHTVDLTHVVLDLVHVHTVRRFFKEDIQCFLETLDGVHKDEHRHRDRKHGIEQHNR